MAKWLYFGSALLCGLVVAIAIIADNSMMVALTIIATFGGYVGGAVSERK